VQRQGKFIWNFNTHLSSGCIYCIHRKGQGHVPRSFVAVHFISSSSPGLF
jgi:hypothetical protein